MPADSGSTPEGRAKPFVLVTGCSRSGTTLLSSLLETSLDVAMPVATMWLAHFCRWLWLWGDAHRYENRLRFLAAVESYLRIWQRTLTMDSDLQAGYTVLPIIQEYGGDICRQHSSWESLLLAIYQRFASECNRSYWGEKNSTFPYLDEIARTIPGLQVIHIVRDGRDVWLSWRKESFGPATAAEAAWRWAQQVRQCRAWAQNNSHRYLEIRYEDLLQKTEAVIADIAAFLRIPVVHPLSAQSKGRLGRMGAALMNPKLAGPVLRENSRWARELPARDIRVFESVANGAMHDLGIQPMTGHSVLGSTVHSIRDVGRSAVSPNLYRLTARSLLPCVLRMTQVRLPGKLPAALGRD